MRPSFSPLLFEAALLNENNERAFVQCHLKIDCIFVANIFADFQEHLSIVNQFLQIDIIVAFLLIVDHKTKFKIRAQTNFMPVWI